jgi:pantoate--beta-alanine ligase
LTLQERAELSQAPKVFCEPDEMRASIETVRQQGKLVGIVPTMGALHAGHLSLVQAAKQECDVTVVSIFLNPTQFAPTEDLGKYPRTFDRDLELLTAARTDFVFAPNVETMYPANCSTYIAGPDVAKKLEGEKRASHFQGVTTVVTKLFHIIPADSAYFGQKDFQQALVLYRMVEDLNFGINIRVCPIVREPDGLAMSSRNVFLSPEERQRALALWRSLQAGSKAISQGMDDAEQVAETMRSILTAGGVTSIDYVYIGDPETLEPADLRSARADKAKVVLLVAAYVGATRLIDNLLITA